MKNYSKQYQKHDKNLVKFCQFNLLELVINRHLMEKERPSLVPIHHLKVKHYKNLKYTWNVFSCLLLTLIYALFVYRKIMYKDKI